MTAEHSLEATTRSESGTGPARAVRLTGRVPAVLYGGKGESVSISVEVLALNRVLRVPGLMSGTISLSVDGKAETVKLQDVQRHPVTELPLHLDFIRV
ncbi:MAG: 50S ribosomal protein L25 [Alphaproteobacteria bacterium]|jgi:large subunit ribosomal protein L25